MVDFDSALPSGFTFFMNILENRWAMLVYYGICWSFFITNVVMFLIEGAKGIADALYIILLFVAVLLVPFEAYLLKKILHASDFQRGVMFSHQVNASFQSILFIVSWSNIVIYLASLVLYGISSTSPFKSLNVLTQLVLYLLLPFCVTVAVFQLEVHRQTTNHFNNVIRCQQIMIHSAFPERSECIESRISISKLRSQYIILHKAYSETSSKHGLFLSFSVFISCALVMYLIWSYYVFRNNFLSISGFLFLAIIICIEMFFLACTC